MTPQNLMVCVVCTVFSNGLWMVCGTVSMVCTGFPLFFVGGPDAQCSCFRGRVTGHTQAMQITFVHLFPVVCGWFVAGLWRFSTFFVGDPDAQCSCFRGHVTGHTHGMQITFSILKFRETPTVYPRNQR